MPTGEPFDPTLLIFAALAVFVLWRLRSVLGEHHERDRPSAVPPRRAPAAPTRLRRPDAKAAPLSPDRWRGVAEPGSPAWAGLDAVAAADSSFSGPGFLDGARKAYEIIVVAFAKGERARLRDLLSSEVYDNFCTAINEREKRGESEEAAVVSIDSATVEEAEVEKGALRVTVRFVSHLIRARRNAAGELLWGGDGAEKVVDVWTFSREARAASPNWRLVATGPAQ